MGISLPEPMVLPVCGGSVTHLGMGIVGKAVSGWQGWWRRCLANPIAEQAPLDPMGLVAVRVEWVPKATIAPHGAWRQLEMADAHWPSAQPSSLSATTERLSQQGQDCQYPAGCLAMHDPPRPASRQLPHPCITSLSAWGQRRPHRLVSPVGWARKSEGEAVNVALSHDMDKRACG